MTTYTDPCSDHDESDPSADTSSFHAWRDVEPVLWPFVGFTDLRRHVVGDACSRMPSPALGAVARMVEADSDNDLAWQLYFDAFAPALSSLARALAKHSGCLVDDCFAVATEELAAVARELCFHGESHAGATVMSRTWARSFAAMSRRRCDRLTGELLALVFRTRTAIDSFAEALAGRSVFARLLTRLAPLDEVLAAVKRCELWGTSFEMSCRERGLLPFAARRQLVVYETRRTVYETKCAELRDDVAEARLGCVRIEEIAADDFDLEALEDDDDDGGLEQ